MKRSLLCIDCANELGKISGLVPVLIGNTPIVCDPFPGEHTKFVKGKSKTSSIVCDDCNKGFKKGDDCVAVSMWADYGGTPYYEWEIEFITIEAAEKEEA